MNANDKPIALVAPCFNEGNAVIYFLNEIERSLANISKRFFIVVVDDCSTDNTLQLLKEYSFRNGNLSLHIISNMFNLGHQGAIYQGLLYANGLEVDYVVIMDSDGEDDPAAIPALIESTDFDIVEVKRGKRSEGFSFRLFYFFYKMLFRLITGRVLDFGNYCMINKKVLMRVCYTSFVHLPAYLLKEKATKKKIRWDRAKRLDGKSKMSFTSLFFHAVRSFIEFAEDLLMLFIKIFIGIIIGLALLLGNILYQKFISHTAILGWASTLGMGLLNLAVICVGFFIVGILLLSLIHQQNKITNKEVFNVIRS